MIRVTYRKTNVCCLLGTACCPVCLGLGPLKTDQIELHDEYDYGDDINENCRVSFSRFSSHVLWKLFSFSQNKQFANIFPATLSGKKAHFTFQRSSPDFKATCTFSREHEFNFEEYIYNTYSPLHRDN